MTSRGRDLWKNAAALLLLMMPLIDYTQDRIKHYCSAVKNWYESTRDGCSALTVLALAALLLAGLRGIRRACGRSGLSMALAATAALLLLISLFHVFFPSLRTPDPADWFIFMLPLAGMALSREVLRLFPWCGSILLAILAVFSFRFDFFTGLPGNWNWNLSLLAVLIPAPLLLIFRTPPRRMWLPLLLSMVFLALFSWWNPELAPRGAAVGVLVSAVAVWLMWKINRRQRVIILCLGGGAGMAMLFSVWLGPADSAVRSSRVWLWRGSAELALAHSICGVGMTNYERQINPYLPREYYFSDFAAERHPHPHSELLAAWSGFGIAGAVFVVLLTLAAVRGFRTLSAVRVWVFWLFLSLFVHGQFDVLLGTPIAGSLCLIAGGALAGVPVRCAARHRVIGMAAFFIAVVLAGMMFRAGLLGREARLLSVAGEKELAREKLRRSLKILPLPQVRYRAGMVELFDFKNPETAVAHLEKLAPGYVHSNGYLARAYAVRGENATALHYFARETVYYPMSALNAYWELEVMKRSGYDATVLRSRQARLNYLLKLRGLSPARIGELIENPALDDAPLRNP